MTKETVAATILIHHRIANFRIPSKVSTDNGAQLVSKVFQAILEELMVNPLTGKKFDPKASVRVQRLYATILLELCYYIKIHEKVLDSYVVPLRYAYNTKVHQETNLPRYSLVLSRKPTGPPPNVKCSDIGSQAIKLSGGTTNLSRPTRCRTEAHSRQQFTAGIESIQTKLHRMTQFEIIFAPEDYVFSSNRH